jgi:hypothetical protein
LEYPLRTISLHSTSPTTHFGYSKHGYITDKKRIQFNIIDIQRGNGKGYNVDYAISHIPTLNNMQTTLYKIRRPLYPPLPSCKSACIIADFLRTNILGENFILHEQDEKKIFLFGTVKDLIKLCTMETIYVDGTFSSVPHIYLHLFTFSFYLQQAAAFPILFIS